MWSFGRFFILVFLSATALSAPATALEAQAGGTLTVSASVPAIKAVYIDSSGNIARILSNSNGSGQIKVFFSDAPTEEVPLIFNVSGKYSKISAAYNLNQIGEVYNSAWPEPITNDLSGAKLPYYLKVFRASSMF